MLKCLLLLFQYHKHLFVHIGSTATYNDPLLEVSDHSCFVSFYVTLRDVTMLYIYGHLCYHLVLFFFFGSVCIYSFIMCITDGFIMIMLP